jgi:hypothetical protein
MPKTLPQHRQMFQQWRKMGQVPFSHVGSRFPEKGKEAVIVKDETRRRMVSLKVY